MTDAAVRSTASAARADGGGDVGAATVADVRRPSARSSGVGPSWSSRWWPERRPSRSPALFLAARTIEVDGAAHLTRSQVLRLAGVTAGTNVFHARHDAAERRLEADPWIARATVATGLPVDDQIAVHERIAGAVTERTACGWSPATGRSSSRAPRVAVGLPRASPRRADDDRRSEAVGANGARDRRDGADAPWADDGSRSWRTDRAGSILSSGATWRTAKRRERRGEGAGAPRAPAYAEERGAIVISVGRSVPAAPTGGARGRRGGRRRDRPRAVIAETTRRRQLA